MRKIKNPLVFILFITITFLSACQEDLNLTETDAIDDQSLNDNVTVENTFDEVTDIDTQVLEGNAEELDKTAKDGEDSVRVRTRTWFCDTVNVYISFRENARRVVVDFGDDDTPCKDGKVRKGKIITVFQKRHTLPGGKITTTFDNYSVNGVLVAGTKIVTRLADQNNKPQHRVQVIDASLTFPNNTQIAWDSDRIRIWQEGFQTPLDLTDDIFSLSGEYSGTNRGGINYAAQTTQPLIYKSTCWLQGFRLPASGSMELKSDNRSERTVDFGDGTCDNKFTVTIGDQIYEITG